METHLAVVLGERLSTVTVEVSWDKATLGDGLKMAGCVAVILGGETCISC